MMSSNRVFCANKKHEYLIRRLPPLPILTRRFIDDTRERRPNDGRLDAGVWLEHAGSGKQDEGNGKGRNAT